MRDLRPDILVVGGDFMDFGCISRFNKERHLTKERRRYNSDCAQGRDELEELNESCGRMVFLMGNHEDWVAQYVDSHPELSGFMDVVENLGLDKLGAKVIPVNEVVNIGKMNFIHGWYYGKYHAWKTLVDMGDNVFYGHTHDHQSMDRRTKSNRIEHEAMSMGCLCDRDPDYWRGKPNNWANGFGWFEARPDHTFNPYFIRIVNGSCSYGGQTWRIQ